MNIKVARQNPYIPRDAIAAGEDIQKRTRTLRDDLHRLRAKSMKWYRAVVTGQADAVRMWENAGNHPDDFYDSPQNDLWEKAVEFCMWLGEAVGDSKGSLFKFLDEHQDDLDNVMAGSRTAAANVEPVRQRTQYSCMAASMAMCLRANDHDVTEDEVNNVMGARPMKGAAWEQALATAQHYGCRATLTMPATVEQLKAWTDAGIPIMIAWNPEGRPWSHASVVFDVDDDLNVYVADPNIPNPKETVRVVSEDDFYHKWYEQFPDYLVRRPACAIEREVTMSGKQVAPTRTRTAGRYQTRERRQAGTFEREVTMGRVNMVASGRTVRDTAGHEWSPRRGLEGPFKYRGGRVLYYDPLEKGGSYYDPTTDMYLDHSEANRIINGRTASDKDPIMKTGRAPRKKKPESQKTRMKIPKKAPKKRNDDLRTLKEQGGLSGAGPHKSKGQRGLGTKGKGKDQRHPKHKQPRVAAAIERVANGFLRMAMQPGNLDRKTKTQANRQLIKAGLDGNGRYRKPAQAYSKALDVLAGFGIELDEIVSSHLFQARPSGTLNVRLAFSNPEDPFSPVSIRNSVLHLQFTELRKDHFEAVAYLS